MITNYCPVCKTTTRIDNDFLDLAACTCCGVLFEMQYLPKDSIEHQLNIMRTKEEING